MREPRLRLRQRRPFVGGHVERRELAPARLERLALGGGRRAAAAAASRFSTAARHARHAARGRAGERREAAERIDERALHLGRGERLVRVLAVEVDEPLADLLQLRERRGPAVDPRAASCLARRACGAGAALAVVATRDRARRASARCPDARRRRTRRRARRARRPAAAAAARSDRRAAARARRAGSTCRRRSRRSAP